MNMCVKHALMAFMPHAGRAVDYVGPLPHDEACLTFSCSGYADPFYLFLCHVMLQVEMEVQREAVDYENDFVLVRRPGHHTLLP